MDKKDISQSLAIIVDEPLRVSADFQMPTPSNKTESKES